MFDTHCHLNFKAFEGKIDEAIAKAKSAGVTSIVVPGTDVSTSKKAAEIAAERKYVYAASGIHPHHIYEMQKDNSNVAMEERIRAIEQLLYHHKVVAVGEVGIDRHSYKYTKYGSYHIDEEFIALQKKLFKAQVKLALTHKKSLILHNREAKKDLFEVLREVWEKELEGKTVFHCCEPDEELLAFAEKNKIFIGVDGDVTYRKEKQEFIKKIPLELLVLETDAPFLTPEPLRSKKHVPNEPKNIALIAAFIAHIRGIDVKQLMNITEENGKRLFGIIA